MKTQFLIAASLGVLLTACGSMPYRPLGAKDLNMDFTMGTATVSNGNTLVDVKAWAGQTVTLTPESAANGAALAALGKMTIDAKGKGQLELHADKFATGDLTDLLAHTKAIFNRNFANANCNLDTLTASAADGKGASVRFFSGDRSTLALNRDTAEKVVLFYADKANNIVGDPQCLGAKVDLKLNKGWNYATISDKGLHTIPDPQNLLLVK